MSSDDIFLFLDFETTGLDPRNLTVLETAWTVTDAELNQLTPLRSRFCALPTGGHPAVPTDNASGWTNPLPPIVATMHESSGLHRDWLSAPIASVLRRVGELDRLLLDDIIAADRPDSGSVHLAGAGVSHFDRPVLDALQTALTFGDDPLLHYRAADVSTAITLLGVPSPKTSEGLDELLWSVSSSTSRRLELRRLDTDRTTEDLVGIDVDGVGFLETDLLVPHRAASDVASALVVSRCLREMLGTHAVREEAA